MIFVSKVPKYHFQSSKGSFLKCQNDTLVCSLNCAPSKKFFMGMKKVLDKLVSLEYNELIKNGIDN